MKSLTSKTISPLEAGVLPETLCTVLLFLSKTKRPHLKEAFLSTENTGERKEGGSWINPKLAPANDPESLSYPVQEKSACSMFPSQARQLIPYPYDTIRNKNLQSFRMTVCDKKGMEPRSVCRHLILRPAVSTAKNSPLSRRESENIRFTGRPASATAQAGQWPPRSE